MATDFRTTWTVGSADLSVYFPLTIQSSATVNWGDGSINTYVDLSDISHTYQSAGSYTVCADGSINGWCYGVRTDACAHSLTDITQVGTLRIADQSGAFKTLII